MYCNDDTAMFLAALALQAEFGDYIPEVKYSVLLFLFAHLQNLEVYQNIHLIFSILHC